MATTAKYGSLEWGAGEWGSSEEITDLAASGTFVISGAASLQLEASMLALGTLAIGGSAALVNEILMAAAGTLVLSGEGGLRTGKVAGILSGCGGPLAADCEEWLLEPFQR